jgi:hypothetical protein
MSGSIRDDFSSSTLQSYWKPWAVGGGSVECMPDSLCLKLLNATADKYADAQITDYAGAPRRDFPWRPPLRMTVRAHARADSVSLVGTAGFGFWNDPFVPVRRELPRLPRAAWFFFGGPRSDMNLALGQPGNGWKAATFDAMRPLFFCLLPLAPLGFLAMRIPALYRCLWPVGQRALGVAEMGLPGELLDTPQDYTIEWLDDRVVFFVDNRMVLESRQSPRGPLGFIAWIDNQYAVITPQGRFGWGLVACREQRLILNYVSIDVA